MRNHGRRGGFGRHGRPVMVALAATMAGPASALEFTLDNGAQVLWSTTVSASGAWRAAKPQANLIGGFNRQGGIGNEGQDDGNLNYAKGDLVSAPVKAVSDLEIKSGGSGLFVRAKAWYDYATESRGVSHGHFANGYDAGARLDDHGFTPDARFKGLRLLDAYGYTHLEVGEHPLDLRLGRQVVNWGESLFVLGLNQANPVDVGAYHKPGTQIKEVLLPVEMAYANLGLAPGTSAEAFYQFKWRPFVLDGCGTYFSAVDIAADASCGATLNAALPRWGAPGTPDPSPFMNDRAFLDAGWVLNREADRRPSGGQWGLALRSAVDAIDAEVGVYHMNFHSRLPMLSGKTIKGVNDYDGGVVGLAQRLVNVTSDCLNRTGMNVSACVANDWGGVSFAGGALGGLGPLLDPFGLGGLAVDGMGLGPLVGLLGTAAYFVEYPKNIKLTGASLATNLFGWSTGFELSQQRDFPVQLNVPDLIHAAALRDGPLKDRVADQGVTGSSLASQGASAGALSSSSLSLGQITGLLGLNLPWIPLDGNAYIQGYDRKTKTQLNLNAIKLLSSVAGASSGLVVAELAVQHVDIPAPSVDGVRYGRGFQWGHLFGRDSLRNTVSVSTPGQPAKDCMDVKGWTDANKAQMCSPDGFFTPWSWGYRVLAQLAYNVPGGVTLKPTAYWAHDVRGSSADYQLVDKRRQLGLLLRGEYGGKYFAELGYLAWYKGAVYDTLRDRDFYSVSAGMTF